MDKPTFYAKRDFQISKLKCAIHIFLNQGKDFFLPNRVLKISTIGQRVRSEWCIKQDGKLHGHWHVSLLYEADMCVISGKLLIEVRRRLSFPTQSSCYLRPHSCSGIVDRQTHLTIATGGRSIKMRISIRTQKVALFFPQTIRSIKLSRGRGITAITKGITTITKGVTTIREGLTTSRTQDISIHWRGVLIIFGQSDLRLGKMQAKMWIGCR